tara:strand:+ start:208 stop:372 length:165 start_codon:yes stop_codon:yes gene_type:complete
MREGGQSFLKNFEKKNEKKLAKFFEKMLRRIEETKLYLGEYVRVRFYSFTMNEL